MSIQFEVRRLSDEDWLAGIDHLGRCGQDSCPNMVHGYRRAAVQGRVYVEGQPVLLLHARDPEAAGMTLCGSPVVDRPLAGQWLTWCPWCKAAERRRREAEAGRWT